MILFKLQGNVILKGKNMDKEIELDNYQLKTFNDILNKDEDSIITNKEHKENDELDFDLQCLLNYGQFVIKVTDDFDEFMKPTNFDAEFSGIFGEERLRRLKERHFFEHKKIKEKYFSEGQDIDKVIAKFFEDLTKEISEKEQLEKDPR